MNFFSFLVLLVLSVTSRCQDLDYKTGARDAVGLTCSAYTIDPHLCNDDYNYDDSDFKRSELCCVCGGGENDEVVEEEDPGCQDLDYKTGARDAVGLTCSEYTFDPHLCDYNYDDSDFKRSELCCVCGGGSGASNLEDKNCEGYWDVCGADCTQMYNVEQVKMGNGQDCPANDMDTQSCVGGNCPTPDDWCTNADDCSNHGDAHGRKGGCNCVCQPEWEGDKCQHQKVCNAFNNCADDAGHKKDAEEIFGHTWEQCCQCTYGFNKKGHSVAGHTIRPDGHFEYSDMTFALNMDFPAHFDVKSIVWKHASSTQLRYLEEEHGDWWINEENKCRNSWTLKENLRVFFGEGSHFVFHHVPDAEDELWGEVEVQSVAHITEYFDNLAEPVKYDRKYRQDVTIKVGLKRTKTVTAKVELKPSEKRMPGVIYVEGYANDMVEGENLIEIVLHIQTGPCVVEKVRAKKGADHIGNEKWSFTNPSFADGVCTQTCTYSFEPSHYFEDKIVLQFETEVTGDKFDINVDIEYVEASVLDYIPFDTEMKFYKTEDREKTATYYRLGNHVYGSIFAIPLVGIPINNIKLAKLRTLQTDGEGNLHPTNILEDSETTYSFRGGYNAVHGGSYEFEFDLESLHFLVSSDGIECIVEAAIEIFYEDGSVLRRQLRRNLAEGNGEEIEGSFFIKSASNVAVADSVAEVKTGPTSSMAKLFFAGLLGAVLSYGYFSTKSKREDASYLLHTDNAEI